MCQAEVTSNQGCLQRSPNNAATCNAFSRVVRDSVIYCWVGTQFSTARAGTRKNSETLLVTSTKPSLRA